MVHRNNRTYLLTNLNVPYYTQVQHLHFYQIIQEFHKSFLLNICYVSGDSEEGENFWKQKYVEEKKKAAELKK